MKQLCIAAIVFLLATSAAFGALPESAPAPSADAVVSVPQPLRTPLSEAATEKATINGPDSPAVSTTTEADKTGSSQLYSKALSQPHNSGLGPIFGLLFRFLLVIGLAYGASLLLRRFHLGRLYQPSGELRVLESVSLGPQRALHIVAVGTRRLLISSCSSQITLVADVTEDYIAEIADDKAPSNGTRFSRGLQEALAGTGLLTRISLFTHSNSKPVSRTGGMEGE